MRLSWNNVAYWAILVSAVLEVEGCAPRPTPEPTPVVICMPQYTYSKEVQAQVANELDRYGELIPGLLHMLGDYETIRDKNAVCIKHQI